MKFDFERKLVHIYYLGQAVLKDLSTEDGYRGAYFSNSDDVVVYCCFYTSFPKSVVVH